MVHITNNCTLQTLCRDPHKVCNEEGKLLSLPLNRVLREPATGQIYDVVAGTFFLCAAPPDSQNFESLSDEQLRHYSDVYAVPERFRHSNGRLLVFEKGDEET